MKFGLPLQKTKKDKVKVDLASITGTYQDKWFGDVVISEKKLFFASKRSSQLSGSVFYKGNYVVNGIMLIYTQMPISFLL
jgi:hypothetical protein